MGDPLPRIVGSWWILGLNLLKSMGRPPGVALDFALRRFEVRRAVARGRGDGQQLKVWDSDACNDA